MRKQRGHAFLLIAVLLAIAGCAGVQVEADTPLKEGELRVRRLSVPPSAKAGEPYRAVFSGIEKKGDGILIVAGCYTWHWDMGTRSDGPYCFGAQETAEGAAWSDLRTGNPRTYEISGYLRYKVGDVEKKSNTVRSGKIAVSR